MMYPTVCIYCTTSSLTQGNTTTAPTAKAETPLPRCDVPLPHPARRASAERNQARSAAGVLRHYNSITGDLGVSISKIRNSELGIANTLMGGQAARSLRPSIPPSPSFCVPCPMSARTRYRDGICLIASGIPTRSPIWFCICAPSSEGITAAPVVYAVRGATSSVGGKSTTGRGRSSLSRLRWPNTAPRARAWRRFKGLRRHLAAP